MSKIYVFLADGFEEIEGLTVVDLLRRAGEACVTVSISDSLEVTGSHQIKLQADTRFADTDFSDASMLVLPGGMPGTRYLGAHAGLCALLKAAKQEGKTVAAICAAPSVLGKLGLLAGEKAACYPGFEDALEGATVTMEPVAVSGQLITSRGMGTAIPFALALIERLQGKEAADKIGKSIIWTE